MTVPTMNRARYVRDRWWPYRTGEVIKRKMSRLWVRWTDNGEVWEYDRAHQQFLEPFTTP